MLFLRASIIFFEHFITTEQLLADNPRSVNRILVVRTDRLGDVILTLPMFPLLRQCFPDAHVAVLLRRYTAELIEGNPYLDEVIWYDRDRELVPFGEMCATLRERKFDAAVVVYPRLRLALLISRSGIPIRIGTAYRYYSFLFNRKVYEHRKDARRHELDYNLNLLKELGCIVPEKFVPEFFIAIPAEAEKAVQVLLDEAGLAGKELVVVHPGSGGSAREWPARLFGTLAARLAAEGFAVAITGTNEEREKVAAVVNASGGCARSLAGRLSIKQLAALLGRARVFVANSTGPLHLAVAVGTPVVGLFPPHTAMNATRWGPYTEKKVVLVPNRSRNCTICVRKGTECECMASIEVDEVLRSAVDLVRKTSNRGAGVHAG